MYRRCSANPECDLAIIVCSLQGRGCSVPPARGCCHLPGPAGLAGQESLGKGDQSQFFGIMQEFSDEDVKILGCSISEHSAQGAEEMKLLVCKCCVGCYRFCVC